MVISTVPMFLEKIPNYLAKIQKISQMLDDCVPHLNVLKKDLALRLPKENYEYKQSTLMFLKEISHKLETIFLREFSEFQSLNLVLDLYVDIQTDKIAKLLKLSTPLNEEIIKTNIKLIEDEIINGKNLFKEYEQAYTNFSSKYNQNKDKLQSLRTIVEASVLQKSIFTNIKNFFKETCCNIKNPANLDADEVRLSPRNSRL